MCPLFAIVQLLKPLIPNLVLTKILKDFLFDHGFESNGFVGILHHPDDFFFLIPNSQLNSIFID